MMVTEGKVQLIGVRVFLAFVAVVLTAGLLVFMGVDPVVSQIAGNIVGVGVAWPAWKELQRGVGGREDNRGLLLLGAVALALATWLGQLSLVAFAAVNDLLPAVPADSFNIWLYGALTLVVAPVCEELLCRGVLFRYLAQVSVMPVWVAAIISSLVFSVLHMGSVNTPALFALGLVLAVVMWRTGSLLWCIGIHAGFNMLSFAVNSVEVPVWFAEPLVFGLVLATVIAVCLVLIIEPRKSSSYFDAD